MFLNVLNNAKQAIDGMGTITIRTKEVEGNVHVAITDSGSGIPEELLTRIFDPGYTTKGVGDGTGLGLSICFHIMEDHGGNIEVDSEMGRGTTFTIVVPTEPAELAERN